MQIAIDFTNPKFIYFLGIIWGDGHIEKKSNKIAFEILKEDFDVIKHIFENFMTVKTRNRHRKNRQKQTVWSFNNEDLSKLLKKCDYMTKSIDSPIKILKKIPEHLRFYFWRGYFDADGCYYCNTIKHKKNMNIAGSYNQNWQELENLFLKLNITYSIERKIAKNGNSSSCMVLYRFDSIENFGNYIYQGEQFGYERKYQKWLETLSMKPKNYKPRK